MKTLYESILDDIDIQMANGEEAVINELINTPKSKLWDILSLSRADAGQKYPLKYENKTLHITRSYLTTSGRQMSLSDAVGAPVDEVVISGGFSLKSSSSDRSITADNFCKKITCCAGIVIEAYRVNNIDLNIGVPKYNGIRRFPSSINGTRFYGVKFIENVNWNSYETTKSIKQITFDIDEIPVVKNCNFNGCTTIRIYSPFLFDGDTADIIHDKWMVSSYEYKYGDDSVTIKNFKKLHAIINNPKKYGTGPVFRGLFKDNIKASDVIPWINDLSDLNHVKICNNSMIIHLFKTNTSDMGFNKYMIEATTTDGWNIVLMRDK